MYSYSVLCLSKTCPALAEWYIVSSVWSRERRPFQKGTFIGDGVARLSVALLGGLIQWSLPTVDPSGDVLLLQPCYFLNLLLNLRQLWFLYGMKEQLLSWLFSFSS